MAKNLVIVESPAKAKTIEGFLGKDYDVKSSFGHIIDLPKKGLNIDIKHDFKPNYEVMADKQKVIADLTKAAKGKQVYLASDEDREGEAIAWHLSQALKLNPDKENRIVFHEITKPAIDSAIKKPRRLDIKLVHAQQARRVLDRLVGYELSPLLWKKVQGGLSAGRVQSVAVRIIIDRERQIKDFKSTSSFKVTAEFSASKHKLSAELDKNISESGQVKDLFSKFSAATFKVQSIDQKPSLRNPSAPFTTSTLQQEASRRLGYSVKQTMTLAQRLYESGHITYMRTDSTILSNFAINNIATFVKQNYGDKYLNSKQYQTKDQSAQEAHEAIRPTHIDKKGLGADDSQKKLYNLIWKRAVASQMKPAELERTEIVISISNSKHFFIAKGEVLIFDGFMKVYGGTKDNVILPPIKNNQSLTLRSALAKEAFKKPPARYSEASLVRKLEELGIGRPSTYAPTISTIQSRGYIEKKDLEGREIKLQVIKLDGGKVTEEESSEITGADKAKLLPTPVAEIVTDFLIKYFPDIFDYDFTATVENDFDDIADGKQKWNEMLAKFYSKFHPLVEKSEKVSRSEVNKARKVGIDPDTKKPIFARLGRYGPMLVRGEIEDTEEKPDFAPLPANTTLSDVNLAQALDAFKLPRILGVTDSGEEIKANIGRFGPYVQVGKTFISIKPLKPEDISLKQALKLYEAKLKKDASKQIKIFNDNLKILNGPYGPYITDGKKNASIDKELDPAKLTEAKALKILEETPVKKFRRRAQTT